MKNELKCPICGKPTASYYGNYNKYGLCVEHSKAQKNGEIEQCSICGNWHNTDEECDCIPDIYTELPVSGFDNCILCGDKSYGYAFCKNCWQEYDDGELLDMLNKHAQKNNDIDRQFSEQEVCIVCGKPSNGKPQCKDCYYETKEYMDSLDKNATITENRNYYYNLKDYTFRRTNIEDVMTNCNKMIAIAINNSNSNGDDSLCERVYKDVKDIISRKKAYFKEQEENTLKKDSSTQKTSTNTNEKEENKVYLLYAEDGHALDSEMEVRIDDILYSSEIFHCCHKPVTEILSKNKTSDWFIPIDGINKGIYIEYWGMNTPKYLADKKEKIELYNEYDIPFIEIQKDEPKNNTQLFKANLIREITKKAEQYFGKMPKWKK